MLGTAAFWLLSAGAHLAAAIVLLRAAHRRALVARVVLHLLPGRGLGLYGFVNLDAQQSGLPWKAVAHAKSFGALPFVEGLLRHRS